jgi:hypothetical protein
MRPLNVVQLLDLCGLVPMRWLLSIWLTRTFAPRLEPKLQKHKRLLQGILAAAVLGGLSFSYLRRQKMKKREQEAQVQAQAQLQTAAPSMSAAAPSSPSPVAPAPASASPTRTP